MLFTGSNAGPLSFVSRPHGSGSFVLIRLVPRAELLNGLLSFLLYR